MIPQPRLSLGVLSELHKRAHSRDFLAKPVLSSILQSVIGLDTWPEFVPSIVTLGLQGVDKGQIVCEGFFPHLHSPELLISCVARN